MYKFLVALILAAMLVGCSENQDDTDRRVRREREMEQIAKDQARQDTQNARDAQQVQDDKDRTPPEPETPPEPTYDDKEFYMFTSESEKTPVQCETAEETACGITFKDCKNDNRYMCQRSVKYFVKTERTRTN